MGKFFRLKTKLLQEEKNKIKPAKSSMEIFEDLNKITPCPYFYDVDTTIYVWNSITKTNKKMKCSEDLVQKLNDTQYSEEKKCEMILEKN